MKKLLTIVSIFVLSVSLTACSSDTKDENTLIVAATLDPHSKILEEAKPILEEEYGINLEIEVLDDYYIFNKSLDANETDANFFQHIPFFEAEVSENGYDIVNVGGIHIEPFGLYSKEHTSIDEIEEGATVVISNSVADNGRILAMLEDAGLITLPTDKDVLDITIQDVIENKEYNPNSLKFVEVKPELLTLSFENNEGDLVAINGNYAIQGGLNPVKDAIVLESADETNPYVNIVATSTELKDDEKIKALVEVLQSEAIQEFITSEYSDGSVIPVTK